MDIDSKGVENRDNIVNLILFFVINSKVRSVRYGKRIDVLSKYNELV